MQLITLAGEKYRYLEKGEIIEKGDILVPDDDETICPSFLTVWDEMIGQEFSGDVEFELVVRKVQ